MKGNILQCRNCGQDIYFDDAVLSGTGKKIPLQFDEQADDAGIEPQKHDCPNNPYKKQQGLNVKASGGPSKVAVDFALVNRVGKLEIAVEQMTQLVKELQDALGKLSFQTGTGKQV